MDASLFHPAVTAWLNTSFGSATPTQRQAWPAIQSGKDVLIAAPTGSGKTLAAFMSAIDTLVRAGASAALPDETTVLYVSPLKALSNDIQRNLEAPLDGIGRQLELMNLPNIGIRTHVRTGDTSQIERNFIRRLAPHIVITTPESLYVLLGSASGREMLSTVRTVIVDEIHALVGNKRGVHLALSLERLQSLTKYPLQRIGLSATQKPIETVAKFLIGARRKLKDCVIVDSGHVRQRDLQIVVPPVPLEAVLSKDAWETVYDQLATLIQQHKTTLIFVNTRRYAERVTRHLSERVGDENITAHHGSLSKERRFNAEQRLKSGELKALVATASLELGIDIGDVDLVCQLGSCRSIATFLQRAGRANHSVSGTPKARLFPLSRDELVESVALLDAVRRDELDQLILPEQPLDVLAQQIVAEVAAREWEEDALYKLLRGAWPYRHLKRETFNEVLQLLADGFGTGRGSQRQYLHRDAVNKQLRGRRGARLTAIMSGGTIPDNADYQVVLEPENIVVGTVNEDFAIESMAGDIFQLGNTSYKILRMEAGRVRVEDARGQPPTIPFWLGEAPGRSDELSLAVSRLRQTIENFCATSDGANKSRRWLLDEVHIDSAAADQLVDYLSAAKTALGALPTQDTIIFERFFDETGGMQLVIHAPFGSRINRAWGLALRKRFCRKFNFELQAAATEDAIVISLSTSHSFPLEEVARYLNSRTVRDVLIQALLDAPMFAARWRWVASIALAIPRFRGGKKTPPQLQRIYAEDLIADVFPDQIACAENLSGPREIPDHPLVQQALTDCLEEAMDISGLKQLLRRIENNDIRILARDTTEPSPLALQVLTARPYAFLDDAPLEERRTQAVISRRWLDPQSASDLGQLDPEAIALVCEQAFPAAINADELHDALMSAHFLTENEMARQPAWAGFCRQLSDAKRVAQLQVDKLTLWVSSERLPRLLALFPNATLNPVVTAPEPYGSENPSEATALLEILRGRLEILGPVTADELASPLGIHVSKIDSALLALEQEGYAIRGRFRNTASEWCERGLLARIHRYTLNRLRAEIEPVSTQDFMRFLLHWQNIAADSRKEGPDALAAVLANLEGFEAPAIAWESEILPSRLRNYNPSWLDDLCLAGRAGWARLAKPKLDKVLRPKTDKLPKPKLDNSSSLKPEQEQQVEKSKKTGPVRTTPIALITRRKLSLWSAAANGLSISQAGADQTNVDVPTMSSRAQRVYACLSQQGALFFDEILDNTRLLASELEIALGELVALGLITADSFTGLRALLLPQAKRKSFNGGKRRQRTALFGIQDAGRWSLLRTAPLKEESEREEMLEQIALTLLRRYGVIFWRLLAREADWLPPWRDLLRILRRLEARGDIRGGRFVAGITGEQFALPEAITSLRGMRKQPGENELVSISAADPLNLAGTLLPGDKVPALAGNRLLLRDGVPVAALVADELRWLQEGTLEEKQGWKTALIRRTGGASQLGPLRARGYRVRE